MSRPSSLQREAACHASIVLPHTGRNEPRAWRGTELHRFLKSAAELGRDKALELVDDEWCEAARAINFDLLPPLNVETGRAEVKMQWLPETGECHDVTGMDRDSYYQPGDFVGAADWVALTEDAVVVIDWKFGFASVAKADVNLQLAAYAVMAAALFKRSKAVVAIGRVLDNGEPWFWSASFDELELDAAAARLRSHLRMVDRAREAFEKSGGTIYEAPIEGEHCRYCPAYSSCPAKAKLLSMALAGEKGEHALAITDPLTAERVSAVYPKLVEAAKLIETLTDVVKDFVRASGPVTLPNGQVLALCDREERALDPQLVGEYIAGHLMERDGRPGVSVADVVKSKPTAKLSDFERAVKATLKPKERLAHRMRDLEADMKKTGALKVFHVQRVEVVSADSKRIAAREQKPTLQEQMQASVEALPEPGSEG